MPAVFFRHTVDCEEQLLVLVRADGHHQQLSITVPGHISLSGLHRPRHMYVSVYRPKYIRDDDRLAHGQGRGGAQQR